MKKLRKYNGNNESDQLLSKLASYAAVAGAFVAFDADTVMGQCATAGAPLPVDIDGDGVDDVTLNFFGGGPYALSSFSGTVPIGTSTVPLNYSFTATATQPGPGTSWNGCITTQTTSGAFTAIVPYATATGPINVTGSIRYINQSLIYNVTQFYYFAQGYVVASAGNSILSAVAGDDACAAVGTFASAGVQYTIGTQAASTTIGSIYYNLNPTGSVCYDAPPCTTTGGNAYSGFSNCVYFDPLQTTLPGLYLLNSTTFNTLQPPTVIPGAQYVAVQFAGGDGTQFGWVEVAFDAAFGQLCVVNTGFNGCSAEEVAAANAAGNAAAIPGTTECITVGTATNNPANEACSAVAAVCSITADGITSTACNDAGTTAPDNSADADDTFDIVINPTQADVANFPTYEYSTDNGVTWIAGAAYGTATTVTLPADGATSYDVIVRDATDNACITTAVNIIAPAACSLEPAGSDIPTLSEWGLITFALLMMSYGSIAMTAANPIGAGKSSNVPLPGGRFFSLPFDNRIYRRALAFTALLVAGGFAGSVALYGAVFMSDIIGTAIAGPVFAYLAHLLYTIETRKEK